MLQLAWPLLFLASCGYCQDSAPAQENGAGHDERWNVFFQSTAIGQAHPGFDADYSGFNSLPNYAEKRVSWTGTIFADFRLASFADLVIDPELAGGRGFGYVSGIAGFTNGEIPRVAGATPSVYIARAYLRFVAPLSGEKEQVDSGPNQLAGQRAVSRLSIVAGKFAISDFFDNNSYSHDPRVQFMNWSLMSNGAWDYPANTRGYVFGLYTEFAQPTWTLRFALSMMTTEANGSVWDGRVGRANSQTLEFEKRYAINGQKGAFRIMAFNNNGKMGDYRAALAQSPVNPVIDSVLAYGRRKYGFGINAEQYLSKDFGVFAKASYNDGATETWFFTEIDRSLSFGGMLKGTSWKRAGDEVGLAFVANGISQAHRNYLAAGGYGFIIGDGKLNYGTEMLAEFYYKVNVSKNIAISPGYQFIVNPAYNKDRGPVNVFSIRLHVEF